ncbi:MAG: sulfite exporter TauE/SafE family protein [Lentisphaeraceae bacterium]|nr:sulfite exporter TauE/SafE family protein [Lentisphaeraceae bacterium]
MESEFFNNLTTSHWILLYLSGLIVGFAKTGVAGIGILAVPIFASIFPAEKSAGILLPVLCVADVLAVTYYRRHADWKKIIPLIPWVAAGLLTATWFYFSGRQEGTFMYSFIQSYMKPTIGVVVLTILCLSLWKEKHKDVPEGKLVAVGTGFSAGFTSMLANAAGPIMNIYLLVMKLPKQAFIGTSAWFFLLINYVKLPLMYFGAGSINETSLKLNAMLIPAVLIGAVLGIKVVKYIPEAKFKRAVQVLVLAACLKLIFS